MPRRNKVDSKTTVDGEVVAIGVNGRPVGVPPTKKEKAVQQKKLFEAAFLGDVQEVVSILELWQDLQVTTQQRYLETKDPDGETPYQLAKRGQMSALTRHKDEKRASRCNECAEVLLCAFHQNIFTALKIFRWEKNGEGGLRHYGDFARAPFQKGPSSPTANTVIRPGLGWTSLHEAAHKGDLQGAVASLQKGADPLLPDVHGRTPRSLALHENKFEAAGLDKSVADLLRRKARLVGSLMSLTRHDGTPLDDDEDGEGGGRRRPGGSFHSFDEGIGSMSTLEACQADALAERARLYQTPSPKGSTPPSLLKLNKNSEDGRKWSTREKRRNSIDDVNNMLGRFGENEGGGGGGRDSSGSSGRNTAEQHEDNGSATIMEEGVDAGGGGGCRVCSGGSGGGGGVDNGDAGGDAGGYAVPSSGKQPPQQQVSIFQQQKENRSKMKKALAASPSKLSSSPPRPTAASGELKFATGKFMADMMLTSYWLNVDEVLSELAAGQRRKQNQKRLEQALQAAQAAAAREKLWRDQASVDDMGRAGLTAQVAAQMKAEEDAEEEEAALLKAQADKGAAAAGTGAAETTVSNAHAGGGGGELKKKPSSKASRSKPKEEPNSWVAKAKEWAPSAVKWGQGVKELYGTTATSVMLDDIKLSTRRLKLEEVPKGNMGPLSRALGHNIYVTSLDLSGSRLGDVGASALAFTVVFNHKLEKLVLDSNGITDEGAKHLSFGLTGHKQDFLRLLSLKDNDIGDDGATFFLFHSWTAKTSVASFSELEPAKLLPVNRVDLLTINLDQNPAISDPTKGRLEKCVEAVFVMRDPLERAAIVTQRAVRRFLKWKAEQKRLEAACTIQTQVREWLPYKHFKAQVVAKLKFFGGFNMPKHVLLRDHAAAQACSDFEYEPPPLPPSPRKSPSFTEEGAAGAKAAATSTSAADSAEAQKEKREKKRRANVRSSYQKRMAKEFEGYYEVALAWAEKHAEDPEYSGGGH